MSRPFRIISFVLLSLISPGLRAQENTESDVTRMQENAHSYLSRGDYANAIMMFSQAIRQAPSDVSLRRDLAYTYLLSGDSKKAKEIIDPVVSSDAADEQTFQVASAIENALGNTGKAKRLLNEGLDKFSNSGLLYNSKGNLLNSDKSTKDALEAYNAGIRVEPSYPMNYYNASKIYFQNEDPVWALLYGELYLNLDPQSQRTIEIKKMMIDAYRKLFSPGKDEELPGFQSTSSSSNKKQNFTSLYKKVMLQCAPAISDGLNVENLIMLRTRFMLAWSKDYSINYPFTLFTYQDKMLHDGVFDAYNQWLFGAVDNSQEFSLWVKVNNKEYSNYESWRKLNPLQPALYDPKPGK
ncbi:MAG: tetratricopeptide repeat protein [Taibaiella sp.]|jgi:tetratricopeptide (TPR) repeat protein